MFFNREDVDKCLLGGSLTTSGTLVSSVFLSFLRRSDILLFKKPLSAITNPHSCSEQCGSEWSPNSPSNLVLATSQKLCAFSCLGGLHTPYPRPRIVPCSPLSPQLKTASSGQCFLFLRLRLGPPVSIPHGILYFSFKIIITFLSTCHLTSH